MDQNLMLTVRILTEIEQTFKWQMNNRIRKQIPQKFALNDFKQAH